MDLLLTRVASDRFGPRVVAAAPSARLLAMGPDGALRDAAGDEVAWEDARVEIACGTPDLFDDGAPLRPFFGLVRRAEHLGWFQSPAAGVDAPFFADLVERGVRLTNAHVNDIPIAEYVLRSVLTHYQQPHRWEGARSSRSWRPHDFREVHGTSWLIVGYGHIGAAVAQRAAAFGARVTGVRRTPRGDERVERMLASDELLDGLPGADVVVLSAPATPATTGLVDERFLAAMRPGSLLVNVGRGALVDEGALVAALDSGVPEGAVLDVTATEPLPAGSPLWDHPRVTLTPHTSAGGVGRHERIADLFLANLGRYLAGDDLLHEVVAADLPGPGVR